MEMSKILLVVDSDTASHRKFGKREHVTSSSTALYSRSESINGSEVGVSTGTNLAPFIYLTDNLHNK